ncbi:LACT-domain-containing protein [Phanerochaete sordida]|uniref:LACT-domain-containing protein n=1 Tax=Phanerochaete sordida TaxID=48140 RepID=A0A9P3GAW1_9APHY|nr:LACT-domain-containing protein [Phanerochaete sordida]
MSSEVRKRHPKVRHSDSDSVLTEADRHSRHESTVEDLKEELAEKVETWRERVQKERRRFYATRRFLFPLGILVGILLGFILIQPSDFTDFQTHLALLLDEFELDFAFPQFPQIDLSVVENEWRRLRSNIPELWKLNTNGLEFTVGEAIAQRGLSAKHPVILIPGIISTGLESWSTSPEYRAFFRQRVWGGFSMITQVTFNREKWMNALLLDPVSGLDPPGAKVRAAEGIDAASSFVQGYWLWSKIVENLAVVNYDTNNLHLAPYDWRLSFYNLEVRDAYFSKLKATIEGFTRREGERAVLVAHSMGSTIILYFFKWIESPTGGNGGSDWVEKNVEAVIHIAGTHLGVAKAMSAFLSGEMRDTVQIHPAGAYVLERFFSRRERRKLFHSWSGSASMWIKGGDAVWGDSTWAPDDLADRDHTHGDLIAFRDSVIKAAGEETLANMTADTVSPWILAHTPTNFQKMVATNYSYGIERDEEKLKENNLDYRKWSNPLEVQLPNAPTTKIFCVYGHGKETERSYWYMRGDYEHDDVQPDQPGAVCDNSTDCLTPRAPLDMPLHRKSWIDADYTDLGVTPKIMNGVKMGEGDGTVSLLSLGAMCVEGWKRKRWNPAGMKVVTVELPHEPVPTIPRGGGSSADHVDILGNTRLNEIILKVATGAEHEVQDNFVSNIREYAKRVRWD